LRGHSARLASLGLQLPPALAAGGSYVPLRVSGDLVTVSGHGAALDGQPLVCGSVPDVVSVEKAAWAARQTALAVLSTLDDELGTLDAVDHLVSVRGYIATGRGFADHPTIMDGASDLLRDVFGHPHGEHARCAVGVVSLPFDLTVEIELVARLVTRP
jgi:enamine deaminase RidA (YjgF/YER057c/UK114 family)